MELSDFVGKPCRSKTAYEFLPKKPTKLNLSEVANKLKKIGKIEVNNKLLLILRIDSCTVTIFSSGKILIRGKQNEEQAKKIAKKVVFLV